MINGTWFYSYGTLRCNSERVPNRVPTFYARKKDAHNAGRS